MLPCCHLGIPTCSRGWQWSNLPSLLLRLNQVLCSIFHFKLLPCVSPSSHCQHGTVSHTPYSAYSLQFKSDPRFWNQTPWKVLMSFDVLFNKNTSSSSPWHLTLLTTLTQCLLTNDSLSYTFLGKLCFLFLISHQNWSIQQSISGISFLFLFLLGKLSYSKHIKYCFRVVVFIDIDVEYRLIVL